MMGFDVYIWYGMKNSYLSSGNTQAKGRSNRIIGWTGLSLVVLLVVVAFIHHGVMDVENPDTGLFYFALVFAAIHALLYGNRLRMK
jgi:basic amino acid/polyamine antiporter, APA family